MPRKNPGLEALLFDFDGTLADLTIDFARLRRKLTALAEPFLGEEPEPSELPVLEWLDELAEEIRSFDHALGQEFHCRGRLVIQATELDAAREAALFPFTRPLLADLRASGVRTGILTRNSTAAVKVVFPDILACCDAFMAREDAPKVKPDPAHALAVLARLGAAPERALLVGDHPLDIQAARQAGLVAAAVESGHSTREVLAAAKPDYLARDCAELVALLRERCALPGSVNP
jgi:phosphoglycolate phosphatase